MIEPGSNVVPFRSRTAGAPGRHPKSLVEAVYTVGSLTLRADDRAAKTAAVMLQALGFLVIHQLLADGTPRPLKRGEARQAMDRPWRLSKPPFAGETGVPDADGAFAKP
ncbi:MAG TPA: hypothetical protein VGU24_06070 [Microvirga sp.]|jgi:hypothetical protein|nr:hypothetical protein [Microvirga sp.]